MGLLSSVFETATREWKWCASNPTRRVSKPRGSAARRRGIPTNTVAALAPNLSGPFGTQVHRAFRLAIETGMRKGEILSLTWAQVSGAVVSLSDTKNGDSRAVALSVEALAVLEEQRGLDPVKVFTVDPASADTLFRKAVKRAGIQDLHFHDSRSEAITRLSKKLDVLELARQVGHRDLKSLLIYYAPSAADMARKLD
jgi:integrase